MADYAILDGYNITGLTTQELFELADANIGHVGFDKTDGRYNYTGITDITAYLFKQRRLLQNRDGYVILTNGSYVGGGFLKHNGYFGSLVTDGHITIAGSEYHGFVGGSNSGEAQVDATLKFANLTTFTDINVLKAAIDASPVRPIGTDFYPINYRLTNATAPGAPTEAAVGDTVTVSLTFPSNYGVVNTNNAYVTNNGVVIPSTYANGVLTFTMPDPSQ